MRLTVESVRHLINPRGQWVAVASGPIFNELEILNWKVKCNSCQAELDFEFAVDGKLGNKARQPAASARIAELGWASRGDQHLCPACQGARSEASVDRCTDCRRPARLRIGAFEIATGAKLCAGVDRRAPVDRLQPPDPDPRRGRPCLWQCWLQSLVRVLHPARRPHQLRQGRQDPQTVRPCIDGREKRFLQALETVQRWDVSSIEQIRFWPAEGKPLRFWPEEG